MSSFASFPLVHIVLVFGKWFSCVGLQARQARPHYAHVCKKQASGHRRCPLHLRRARAGSSRPAKDGERGKRRRYGSCARRRLPRTRAPRRCRRSGAPRRRHCCLTHVRVPFRVDHSPTLTPPPHNNRTKKIGKEKYDRSLPIFSALSYVPRTKISYLPSIPHGDGKRWCLTMRINNTPIPHDNLVAINRGQLALCGV